MQYICHNLKKTSLPIKYLHAGTNRYNKNLYMQTNKTMFNNNYD